MEEGISELSGMNEAQAVLESSPFKQSETLRMLAIHLRALGSYFRLTNHPLTESHRLELLSHDFTKEASTGRDFLLLCSTLLLTLKEDYENRVFLEDGAPFIESLRYPNTFSNIGVRRKTLEALTERVNDLSLLGGALVESRRVSFEAWSAFGKIVSREVEQRYIEALSGEDNQGNIRTVLPDELRNITARIAPDPLASDIYAIFSILFDLLELLRYVGKALASDAPLKQTLPFFTLLREKSNHLSDLICERILSVEGLDTSIYEQLDATAYALRMELKKTFEHELVGLVALHDAHQIYARIENAHGLLRDCFQQSVISIARTFNPTFDGATLFSTFQTKQEQSLVLRADLWRVLSAVRRAETDCDDRSFQKLSSVLSGFRGRSLRYLMYKDWEAFERFLDEVSMSKEAAELSTTLHRFHAFLETLFSQVNMRAVLMNHPFVPSADE